MLEVRELAVSGIILRILCAIVFGGIIGFERGLKNRPAGFRTYMLVSIGSCVVMLVNQYAYQVYQVGDPVRLGAQVVSGIGFLGAGTIIVTPHNQIKGLTTAAGLWASACIGLAIGIGLYEVAVVATVAVYTVLTILHHWDSRMRKKTRVIDVYIELDSQVPFGSFVRAARNADLELRDIQKEDEIGYSEDSFAFIVTIKGKANRKNQEQMVEIIRNINGVRFFEVL